MWRARTAYRISAGVQACCSRGPPLFDSLPVWKNVGFRLLEQAQRPLNRHNVRQIRDQVNNLLAQVDLEASVGDLQPSNLSGGMQKRVGLAAPWQGILKSCCLMNQQQGWIPYRAHRLIPLIASLTRHRGATSLTITHDLASAREIADRVVLLHDGRLVWQGPPSALDTDADPMLRQFVDGQGQGL